MNKKDIFFVSFLILLFMLVWFFIFFVLSEGRDSMIYTIEAPVAKKLEIKNEDYIDTHEFSWKETEEDLVLEFKKPEPQPKPDPKPTPVVENKTVAPQPASSGSLNKTIGVFNGPSGKETYYNLDMSGVINIMRNSGFSEDEYPYWERDDGCKMFGPYIMLGGDIINTRKRGDIVETSLGLGMMCDHCVNAQNNDPTLIDIAVTW